MIQKKYYYHVNSEFICNDLTDVYKEYVGDFILHSYELTFPGHARRGVGGVEIHGKISIRRT